MELDSLQHLKKALDSIPANGPIPWIPILWGVTRFSVPAIRDLVEWWQARKPDMRRSASFALAYRVNAQRKIRDFEDRDRERTQLLAHNEHLSEEVERLKVEIVRLKCMLEKELPNED